MLRFGETKVAKEKFCGAKKPINIWDVNFEITIISTLTSQIFIGAKKPINIWDVNVDIIVISKLVEKKEQF